MRFKDVRQHKKNELEKVIVDVQPDTWGTFTVKAEHNGITYLQNSVVEFQVKKVIEQLKKQAVRQR